MRCHYMMIMGCVCLVFAYASVIGGNMMLGCFCGLLSLVVGIFVCYSKGLFQIHVGWLMLQIPFIYCSYQLFMMPYEVSYALGMVNMITVGYGLLLQVVIKDFSITVMKELRQWLTVISAVVCVCWSVILIVFAFHFDSLLVGNEWISLVDALSMEWCCLFVFCGVFFTNGLYCWFLENEEELGLVKKSYSNDRELW